ncbi:MAG: hypothetical protein Alis3KO_26250 [Aliiglaciecola sp.]
MSNKIKLNDSIVGLSLDFQHACGLATCLLLAEEKLSHDDILNKFEDFSRLVSHMKGLQLRIEKLSDTTDSKLGSVDIDVVKDVISTHEHIDSELWELVSNISCAFGETNIYDDAFLNGLFGISNMLKRIDDGLKAIINIESSLSSAA